MQHLTASGYSLQNTLYQIDLKISKPRNFGHILRKEKFQFSNKCKSKSYSTNYILKQENNFP